MGKILNASLSLTLHVQSTQSCYLFLQNASGIRPFLSTSAATTRVHTSTISCLDHCHHLTGPSPPPWFSCNLPSTRQRGLLHCRPSDIPSPTPDHSLLGPARLAICLFDSMSRPPSPPLLPRLSGGGSIPRTNQAVSQLRPLHLVFFLELSSGDSPRSDPSQHSHRSSDVLSPASSHRG